MTTIMKPEAINQAIAEACGFTGVGDCMGKGGYFLAGNREGYHKKIPDYLNDLNAMHEAEKMLKTSQWKRYAENICSFKDPLYGEKQLHATAAQRSEAFLKTLDLWK